MESQKFKFIDGKFSAKDAKDILMNVYEKKIQYHHDRNFSSQERFGEVDEISAQRLPDLIKNRNAISLLLNEAVLHGYDIVISSEVEVTLVKAEENCLQQVK